MKGMAGFAAGLGAGLLAVYLIGLIGSFPAAAGDRGDGQGGVAKENGDVNGNGGVDITDAINLLEFLFLSGPPPVTIDCEPAAAGTAQVRLFNDLLCQDQPFTGQIGICGVEVTDFTDDEPSDCVAVGARSNCSIKVTATTDCGEIVICDTLPFENGKLYDHVLTVNNGVLELHQYIQDADPQAPCPAFPALGSVPDRILISTCAAAAGAGASIPGAAGSWTRRH